MTHSGRHLLNHQCQAMRRRRVRWSPMLSAVALMMPPAREMVPLKREAAPPRQARWRAQIAAWWNR